MIFKQRNVCSLLKNYFHIFLVYNKLERHEKNKFYNPSF